jgi:hypothetical protein
VTTSDRPSAPRGLTRQDVFSLLGALGGVLTLITAVLFYFGWRRSDVQARAMNIDVSLFGFSTQDYVLRSISALYLPLLVVLSLGLGWLWVHLLVVRLLRSDVLTSRERRTAAAAWTLWIAIAGVTLAVGCLLFALAVGTRSPPPLIAWLANRLQTRQWVVPLVLVVATLIASYAWWIHRQMQPNRVGEPRHPWQMVLPAGLVAGTVVLGAFWMLEEYAAAVGRGYALQLSQGVDRLARTVVISPTPLGIVAPGVTEERLGRADSPDVRYRTIGLRLLARSGDKILLVHDGWAPGKGTVIVLPDSDDLAWQFSR